MEEEVSGKLNSFKKLYLTKGKNLYFIAEIGINHNGDFNLAKRMIDESKKCGAKAVKFQKRDWKSLLLPGLKPEKAIGYLSKNEFDIPTTKKKFGSWTYPDTRLEFSEKDIKKLWKYANNIGLDFIISPWDEKSVDFLKKNKAKVIKLASVDAKNYHFCTYIAKTRIPTIVSTGMCNYDEILRTKLLFEQFNCPVMFLHCSSSYPSELEDKNLNCIPIMQNLLENEIGFSGHGIGDEGTLGAVALGCKVIEKHVTFNKKMSGPDHAASLEFSTFKSLIKKSKDIQKCLGTNKKRFLESEKILHKILGKKFYITKSLKKGSVLSFSNIRTAVTKTKDGINPEYYYQLIGKKLVVNKKKGSILNFKDINLG